MGVDEPVYYQGRSVGRVKRYSDVLLIFLLKGIRPDVYRERYEHTGADGGPIRYEDSGDARERLARRIDELASRRAAKEAAQHPVAR